MKDSTVIHARRLQAERIHAVIRDVQAERIHAVDQLADTACKWWFSHRPVGWTETQHQEHPAVNIPDDAGKALAHAVANSRRMGVVK